MTTKRKQLETLANQLPDYKTYRVVYGGRGKGYRLDRMDGMYGKDRWTCVKYFLTAAAGEDWLVAVRREMLKCLRKVERGE
jgi:hypothetical protein